jgi:hypothetical protein
VYIPLSADTYDVYKGRKICHKYYGYGRIVEYKKYSLRKGGGYGYYCKFDKYEDYTYTFATTSRFIQKLSNTILIETFPFEMIVELYCDYITKRDGEAKTKQEALYNMLKNSTASFSEHLGNFNNYSGKQLHYNQNYKKMTKAAFDFFKMEATPRDFTDTVTLMQELEELEIKNESNPNAGDRKEFINKWGKVFLGLPDNLFSDGDHVNSEELKGHFRALTPSFAPTESEANTRLKRIKIDSEIDGKLQKLLKMVWSMYKPNTPSSREIVLRGGVRGGDAGFILRLIFLPAVIVFLITLIGLLIVGGLIVVGFILLAIPLWAPVLLLFGIGWYITWDDSQGGGGPRRRISMARRDKTKRGRRSGSRKKTRAKRPRRISLN